MNTTQTTKKPFGLSLACKIAAEALKARISINNRKDDKSGCVAKLILLNNTSKND